jgi:hypothetical protein
MVYGVRVIQIQPVRENEFITDVIKLKDVVNNVQLLYTSCTTVKMIENVMKIVDLIYSTRISLSTSKYGAYAYLTILKNGEQQLALVHPFLKIIFASTSSECLSG